MGNSNDYDYWWESLTEEDLYWSGMTENDRLYGLEPKPEVDMASYELRKMADAREQYTEGRFAVLSNLIREITDCEVEWAKREIQCLTHTSIEKMEDNLFDVLRVVEALRKRYSFDEWYKSTRLTLVSQPPRLEGRGPP